MQVFMAKYRIAWLPGDGIGSEGLGAAEVDRTYRIGSENAFRIGPQIRELERIHTAVTDVNGFQQFIQEDKHLC
jgi:hypothetical protein